MLEHEAWTLKKKSEFLKERIRTKKDFGLKTTVEHDLREKALISQDWSADREYCNLRQDGNVLRLNGKPACQGFQSQRQDKSVWLPGVLDPKSFVI